MSKSELLKSKGYIETDPGRWVKGNIIMLDPNTDDNIMYVQDSFMCPLNLDYLDNWEKDDRSKVMKCIFDGYELEFNSKYTLYSFLEDTGDWGTTFRCGKTYCHYTRSGIWLAEYPDGYEIGDDLYDLYLLICRYL